jgi:hypothetical protein
MQQLPLASVMLWGVVAVELQEADAAREMLGTYLEATQGRPAGGSHAVVRAQMVLHTLPPVHLPCAMRHLDRAAPAALID